MRISRDEALALFHQGYPAKIVVWSKISPICPDNCRVGLADRDCWFVKFSLDREPILCSSRLFAVSKSTGEIIYDGSANNEG